MFCFLMRQILDIAFVKICVVRRNYNSKFNELTPMGWAVVGSAAIVFFILLITVILLIRSR